MPGCTAGSDLDRRNASQVLLRDVHLVEVDLAGVERDPPLRSVAHGTRLLIDLFEHKVLKSALLSHDRVPCDPLLLGLDNVAVKICNADRVLGQDRDLAITEKENVTRMVENGGNVRRDKKLAVAKADHNRRPLANRNDHVGLIHRDDGQGKDALKFLHRLSDGKLEREPLGVDIVADQMSNDLGIGLGLELVPLVS